MTLSFGKNRAMTAVSGAAAALSLAALTLLATTDASFAAAAARFRSAHFIVSQLETKGLKVEDVRRKGELYMVKVSESGTTALLAIDGYSSELVGLHVISLAPGAKAKPRGTAGNHFVDITYDYGYVIEESAFLSYTEVSSTELTSTEDYSEVSISSSDEIKYDAVDDATAGDLDQGLAGDDQGDQAAVAEEGGSDDTATADDSSSDDSAASSDESSGGDSADSGSSDGDSDGGSDGGGDQEQ